MIRQFNKAIKHYSKYGYKEIEYVPIFVDKEIINITIPSNLEAFKVSNNKYLVGSAEQSILDIIIRNNYFGKNKLMAFSPCFRDEPTDYLHQKVFYKLELFSLLSNNPSKREINKNIESTLNSAQRFFKKFSLDTKIVKLDKYKYDIVDCKNNIELGSYGYNYFSQYNIHWVYGTGLAEPRLSTVLNLI